MAGTIGATFHNPISPFNPHYLSPQSLKPSPICIFLRNTTHRTFHPTPIMTQSSSQNQNKPHGLTPFLKVKRLSEKAILPSRGSPLSAGYDLSSAIETKVPARGKALIPTDLSIAVPEGTYARVAPRSGLAWKHSIDVGAGVIDADYRGPVGVILFNH